MLVVEMVGYGYQVKKQATPPHAVIMGSAAIYDSKRS